MRDLINISVTKGQSLSAITTMDAMGDFDWEVYTQLYEDLKVLSADEAYSHWLTYGHQEGRVASAAAICHRFDVAPDELLPYFNWHQYLSLNADLRGHLSNQWQALFHYCQFGLKEGREYTSDPAVLADLEAFDWEFYLWHNPDITGITSEDAAKEHWQTVGKAQGRLGSSLAFYIQKGVDIRQLPDAFDAQEYLSLYPDLQSQGLTEKWPVTVYFLSQPETEREIYSFKSLGLSLRSRQQYSEAIQAFEAGLERFPNDWTIQTQLAEVFILTKDWEKAVSLYQAVTRQEIDSWSLYECNQSLSQLIKKQMEITLSSVKSLANELSQAVERYQQQLKDSSTSIEAQAEQDSWHHFQTCSKQLSKQLSEQLGAQQLSASADLVALRQTYQAIESAADLSGFIAFPRCMAPVVSVIIPVYNKLDYTIRCLRSLMVNASSDLKMEVVVVNDCSSDATATCLDAIEGLVLVNNERNLGFIRACNAGARVSKGKYLYFLNNDTEILPDTVESLIDVLQSNPRAGAVGSKLVYPSGALQEAGGIIWQDASGWNYGRDTNPYDPQYNFMRSVDYCSGASLLVSCETFESLGGFDTTFVPAYYEDTDLCFAIRHQLGLEVIYQPKSVVIHYEGVSSGISTTSGIKRYQAVNAQKFEQKWHAALKAYPTNTKGVEDAHRAARRFQGDYTVLVTVSYLPLYDKESASRRLFQILKIFKRLNYHVIFLPDDMRVIEPYASELQRMQVEVLYTCDGFGKLPEDQLREHLPLIDVAWVCRPGLMQRYLPVLKERPKTEDRSAIMIIYDTIDLHYLRMKRDLDLGLTSPLSSEEQRPGTITHWADMQRLELEMAAQADLTLTVTGVEQTVLQQQGIESVAVIPNIHLRYEGRQPRFDERSGLLFIGGYNHPPNVDAVEWLCREIMPRVWERLPEVTVTLLGSNPAAEVKALASDRVIVPGYVADVTPYFLQSRVFVAPLRYGAGMKGKIGQRLEYGLPLVSTAIGFEGMNLTSGESSLEANDTIEFANAVVKLYTDRSTWDHIAGESSRAIASYSPNAVKSAIEAAIVSVTR